MASRSKRPLFILDFDGVIADTYDSSLRAVRTLIPYFDEKRYQDALRSGDAAPLPRAMMRRLVSFFILRRLAEALRHDGVIPGVKAMIRKLASWGDVVVVTSGRAESVREFLRAHDLSSLISDLWAGSGSISKRKGLRLMKERYGSERSCILFFTDTAGDIQQAKIEGIPVVAVTWGYQTETMLRSESPDFLIRKPSQVDRLMETFRRQPPRI